ncbi:MAG: hypothetical protein Q4E53_13085 [Eubacteriales bacterium]|nr:hypothetical protein [Eubacteriales bacterium]
MELHNNTLDIMLYNQLITQVYLHGKKELEYLFPDMNIAEYIVLHIIAHIDDMKEEKTGKVYLKELSTAMEMSLAQTSQLAQSMQENGLIEWTHDPINASNGTYITISENGKNLLGKQAAHLMNNLQAVREEIATEELLASLKTLNKIREILANQNGE